jgi:glycosyltransferase involved in cell wall biosynthesis
MMKILFEPDFSNIWLNILLFAFGFCVLIQLLYYWGVFSRLAFYKRKDATSSPQPVSIVICAKNEFHNLDKNLPLILDQDYPDFEVVVVDDCSDDDTYYLLKALSDKYERLKVLTLKETVSFVKGKKFPLAVGIKSTQHDILLLTDADCCPKSNRWIYEMQSHFTEKSEIVLGYGGYEFQKGAANRLIRFDTVFIAMQYLSYALMGMPYMGVGRNLAYRKSLFYKNKGFSSIYHIKSGDDDLFVNQAATKKNTRIEIQTNAQTVSIPEVNFPMWLQQKRRHMSTGKYYKFKHKFLLTLFSITLLMYYILFIILMIYLHNIIIIVPLFILRTFSQMFIFKKCMNKLDEKKLLLISPWFEVVINIINPLLMFSNSMVKQNKWK